MNPAGAGPASDLARRPGYPASGTCGAPAAGSARAPEECTVAPPTTVRAAEIDGMSSLGTVK